jgi:hypothetical protein
MGYPLEADGYGYGFVHYQLIEEIHLKIVIRTRV